MVSLALCGAAENHVIQNKPCFLKGGKKTLACRIPVCKHVSMFQYLNSENVVSRFIMSSVEAFEL